MGTAQENVLNWTEDRVELLRKLWSDGLSASQIAAQIGGVSRNAVIGKVHRLKLSGRGKQTAAQPRVKKAATAQAPRSSSTASRGSAGGSSGGGSSTNAMGRVSGHTHTVGATALKAEFNVNPMSAQVLAFVPTLVAPEPKRIKLIELSERTCKWPLGDPLSQEFAFCGHEAGDNGPYCQFHSKMAYQPASERRRAR